MKTLKKRGIYLFLLIISIIGFFLLYKPIKRIEVKGYKAKKQELQITVTATSTGTIKADYEIRLTAQRPGTISRLYVEEGSIVNKGSDVASLEFQEAQERLQLAAAVLQKLQANLDALNLSLVSFRQDVDSNIEKTRATLLEAEARYKRFNDLFLKGYISQLEFDTVSREYDVAKANYSSALAAREQIKSKEKEIKAQEAAIQQARNEYNLARISYDYSFLRSPINGIITERPVKLGDTVPVGTLIATVVATDSLYIEAFIDEADVAKVVPGQAVKITMDAYPERIFNGKVYMISPVVLGGKQEARTFEVRVRLLDKGIVIKPGMSADVEVIINNIKDALIVPSQAIIEKGGSRYVFLDRNGKAVMTKVKTGNYNWNFTEITGGIKEGDTVIVNPDIAGLKNGARIKTVIEKE